MKKEKSNKDKREEGS